MVSKKQVIKNRLYKLKTIIIDEAVMLKKNEIEAIDFVLRNLTTNVQDEATVFGGRQIVLSGDIYQLEPVGIDNNSKNGTIMESFS